MSVRFSAQAWPASAGVAMARRRRAGPRERMARAAQSPRQQKLAFLPAASSSSHADSWPTVEPFSPATLAELLPEAEPVEPTAPLLPAVPPGRAERACTACASFGDVLGQAAAFL